jgi:hypothetical protein
VARFPKEPGEPAAFTSARETAQKLADNLAQRIPSLQINIVGVTETALLEVRVDGALIPNALLGLPRKTNPGEHRITALVPGRAPLEAKVQLGERAREVVTIDFARAATSTTGHGAGSGETAGEATATGGPPPDVLPIVAYASFGLAGAGLLVGAITGGVSLSTTSSVKDTCTEDVCPTSSEADAQRALTLAHVSTVSFVVAGAAAAVGVVTAILAFSDTSGGTDGTTAPAARVEPVLGPGMIGLRGWF